MSLIVLLTALGTWGGYAGGYYALIVPGYVRDFAGPALAHQRRTARQPFTLRFEKTHHYRIRGWYVEDLFRPMRQLDRRLRPNVWYESFTFTPAGSSADQTTPSPPATPPQR